MMEHTCGIDLNVTCADGSSHQGVTMKIVGGEVIYECTDGQRLTGATKVISTQAGMYACNPMQLAAVLHQYREQEK